MATAGDTSASTSVVYVGDGPALSDTDGIEVLRVDGGRVADHVDDADCVLAVEPGDGLDVLATVAETSVPTVLYDRTGDSAVAARATRLGVTEYVTDAVLEAESLADRVLAVVAGDGARAEGAFESLHAVVTDRSLSPETKISRLLDVGRERLGLELGFLTEIADGVSTVVAVRGSHPGIEAEESTPLERTFCRRTIQQEALLGVEAVDADDPMAEATGLRCYLGGRVVVEGDYYGTLCFASPDPRQRAFSRRERRFVELLVEWVSHEIERGRQERALRRYKAVHETVEEMVFVIGEGTHIELVTGSLIERFGYERDELLGEPATAFLSPDAVQKGYAAFEELRADAASVTIETTLRTADGVAVPTEIDVTLLSSSTEFEGLVGVVRDRTELSETRAELEAERDRFQSLFDQLPDAVVDAEFTDGVPYVRAVNPAFEEVFGYDAESALGEPVNELIVPAEHRDTARRLDDEAMADGQNIAEVERETTEGRRTFLFRGFLYSTDGPTDRGFGIYTDVTDSLEQERRLRVLDRVLRHNLRNEMTAIIGYAQLLGERVTDAEDREYAERIHEQARDVAKLGEQVQRIEQALDRDRKRLPLDPGRVATDIAGRFRQQHPAATIRVTDNGEDVVGDELLELAVENLVENAIEHNEGTPTVDIDLSVEGQWVDLTIRDDGPGIPEREQAVVSGQREITQLDHSRGLGLWVARWIVEGVGGQLRFGDCKGGSAVTLRLQRLSETSMA